MKSKASIKSHPVHPILVSFPIAFFTGALVFDIIALINNKDHLHDVSYYLLIAGLIGGVLAAIPGIIDYTFTVPPDSSAKKRGAKHGLTNTLMMIVFAYALYYRQTEEASLLIVTGIELLGLILMLMAGWMGGTLVYRNEIGVDRRYADAGKWNEEYFSGDGNNIKVASESELKTDQMKLVHVNGKRIVIARSDKGFAAFDDRCTHKGGSLAGGSMSCGTVQCPWHGSQFDVHSGRLKAGPATNGIQTYPVTVSDGFVYLNLNIQHSL